MKIYHYTTIETLALILESKYIKFSRLDMLDDKTESEPFSVFNPLQYIFSSSYTYDDTENIPLWKMYANMETGIRIEFDTDTMFSPGWKKLIAPTHNQEICKLPPFLYTSILSEDILNSDYLLYYWNRTDSDTISDCIIKIKKIEYKDNFVEIYKSKLNINDINKINSIERNISYNPTDFGFYKSNYWEFQKEIRLLIYSSPFPKDKNEISEIVSGKRELKTTSIFVPLSEKCLQNIKITLSPKVSKASRIIVKALLSQYPNAVVVDSCLHGTIR